MQSNTAKQHAEVVMPTPGVGSANDNARRIMARTRYQAPTVMSFPISGFEQSGQLSMIGQQGLPPP